MLRGQSTTIEARYRAFLLAPARTCGSAKGLHFGRNFRSPDAATVTKRATGVSSGRSGSITSAWTCAASEAAASTDWAAIASGTCALRGSAGGSGGKSGIGSIDGNLPLDRGPGMPDQRRQTLLKHMRGWEPDYIAYLTKRG